MALLITITANASLDYKQVVLNP
ncbi:MAG: hypothetical protein QOG21_1754, partial [Actinomycetota bacterium]|nr:hypothetical protein [Actinomycetota bacterium]